MKLDASELTRFRELLTPGKRVLATTHVRPDPDAIGSVLAIAQFLRQVGCQPTIALEDRCPSRCRFLPGADQLRTVREISPYEPFDTVVIVDSGDRKRIGDVQRLIAEQPTVINIDHHGSNDLYGTINFVFPDTAACGELLYFLFQELNVPLDADLATNLFAGLLTDTGRFRHSNTTARSLRVAAELMEAGADGPAITEALYYAVSVHDVRAIGTILSHLELVAGGQVCLMFVHYDELIEDSDHAIDYARAIIGVELAALLSETDDGRIRVSLRSKARVNVAQLAESFGGGGHLRAAGFRMRGTLAEVRERVLPALIDAVNAPTPAAAD